MMHKYMLDLLDRLLKVIMNIENIMGGKLILLVHDFRQILPVITGGLWENIVAASIKKSNVWIHVINLSLQCNMRIEKLMHDEMSHQRQVRLHDFSKWLLSVGDGMADMVYEKYH